MKNKNLLTLVVAAALAAIFALLLFTFQVRQSEVVVLSTFGKPAAKNIEEPGAYFKWPWPVQSVNRFDQRVQNFEDKLSENFTADNNMILTSIYVGWRISDASQFLPALRGSIAAAQEKLEGILRSAKTAVIGGHRLSELVNANPQDLQFEKIEGEIRAAVQKQLATYNYGVSVEFLGIKKLGLPEGVTQSVFETMKSERNKYISKAQAEGESEANMIKSAAERQAAEVVYTAQAAATRIRGEGEAEAAKTLTVFQQNPELAIFLMQIEALKESLNQKSTLILDERTPPFDLFRKLPGNPAGK